MSDPLQTAEMPKLDTFDEEFGQRRLVMLAVVALCAGTIAALAFAWSSADGQLRLELQSITPSPRTVAREGAEEEIGRLRRRMDEFELEIRELTQARQQADDTIAALQAAQQEARGQVPLQFVRPGPLGSFSGPAALLRIWINSRNRGRKNCRSRSLRKERLAGDGRSRFHRDKSLRRRLGRPP
jgi:hypothetical protein